MRIKVNSLTLGLVYEVCFICSERTGAFLEQAKEVLERDYACKTFVYVYDRDPLDAATQKVLKQCVTNVFVLDDGVCVTAAADANHPFRQVYAFVQANNLHSIGLISTVEMKHAKFPASVPQEMDSLNWLHQIYFDVATDAAFVTETRIDAFAEKITTEIRRNFSHREKKRFLLYPQYGDGVFYYHTFAILSTIAAALSVVTMFMKQLWFDIPIPTSWGFGYVVLELLRIVALLAAGLVAYVAPVLLVTWLLWFLSRKYSVSTTFADFRAITTTRLAILFSVLGVVGVVKWITYIENLCGGGDGPLGFIFVTAAVVPCMFNVILCACFWVMDIKLSPWDNFLTTIRKKKILAAILVPSALLLGVLTVVLYFALLFP